MSDIIRGLRYNSVEQEERQTQRAINRLIRAVKRSSFEPTPKLELPARPQFPSGVVPVFVINQPRRLR